VRHAVSVFLAVLVVASLAALYMNWDRVKQATAKRQTHVTPSAQQEEPPPLQPGGTQPPEVTPPPEQKQPSPEVKQQPEPRILLPESLKGVRFGMSSQELARLFAPDWRRETRESLTLVHYADKSKTKQVRFHFQQDKLRAIEIRLTPASKEELAPSYNKLQKQMQERYGSLPDSKHNRWSDGHMVAQIGKGTTYISLTFGAVR